MERTEITKRNPEFTDAVADAVDALGTGRRAEAQRALARAVLVDPENATAWYWLGRSLEDESKRAACMARVRRLDRARVAAAEVTPATRPPSLGAASLPPRHRRPGRRTRWAVAVALLIVAVACLAAPLLQWRPLQARAAEDEPLAASGTIYAPEIELASEYGGRIDAVLARSGERVVTGQVLVQLATDLLDAQIEAAQAAVDLAEAGLAQAQAGARPGQIAVAEAQLAMAEAGRIAAAQAVSDTAMLVAHPQEIDLQIAVTRAQAQAAEHDLVRALALKDAAEIGKDRFYEAQSALREAGGPGDRRIRAKIAEGSFDQILSRIPPELRDQLPSPPSGTLQIGEYEIEVHGATYTLCRWVTVNINLPFEAHLAPNAWWQAWVGVNAASATAQGLTASLGTLYEQRRQPQESLARADQAAAALAQAEARLTAAQAQLDGLRAGPSAEQVGVLEAKVEQARAALDALRTQREQMVLTAPVDGSVIALTAHEGEIAAAGAPLLTLAQLERVRLTVYIPETELGRIRIGQAVQVYVTGSTDQAYEGMVVHIADRAEFTPRNVSTKEQRADLVFAVEIDLPSGDGALKPGMPADATFGP